MKRRDKTGKKPLFGVFEKKKPVVGEEIPPKTIRHLERTVKLPFLADMDELRKYADDKGLNILGAGEYRKYYDSLDTVNIDPFEWAYLFKNAAYVVTGTFHGTSFSVKYNRKFVSFLTEANRVNKVGYLLTTLGLESHIVMGEDEDNLIEVMEKDIEYTKVNEIIDKKVKESKKYLFESIGDDINSGA